MTTTKQLLTRLRKERIPFKSQHNVVELVDSVYKGSIKHNVEEAFGKVLDALLLDWKNDPHLRDTPRRLAKMYVDETFRGRYENPPKVTAFDNETAVDQLYVVGPVDVKSTCAHHFQPFVGTAFIGVLLGEDSKVIGLSKFNRVVDHLARRPSIQEVLTQNIANFFQDELNPKGLAVMITSAHFCVYCRGVEQKTNTTTCEVRGQLADPVTKAEFFELVKQNQRPIF